MRRMHHLMLKSLSPCARRYHFFDSDALVEQAAGKAVAAIFAEDGEGDFREAESSVMQARSCLRRCRRFWSCHQVSGIHAYGMLVVYQDNRLAT